MVRKVGGGRAAAKEERRGIDEGGTLYLNSSYWIKL